MYRGSADSVGVCKNCSQGFFQQHSAQASCLPCVPGRVSMDMGASSCDLCPTGYLQKYSQGRTCDLAPPGAIVQDGGSASTSVAPGWHMTECDTQGQCRSSEPCQPGTRSYLVANASCALCEPGKTSYEGIYTRSLLLVFGVWCLVLVFGVGVWCWCLVLVFAVTKCYIYMFYE
jgi:hypothetical protein